MDINQFLREMRSINLCTFYLLPLTGLTKSSFDGIFVNSYLEPKRYWIIVQVADIHLVSERLKQEAITWWANDRGGFLCYRIGRNWSEDVDKFIHGHYSRFSALAKHIICERSGLPYRESNVDEPGTNTDLRLLALERSDVAREYLEKELGTILDPRQELLGIPPPESFMVVE